MNNSEIRSRPGCRAYQAVVIGGSAGGVEALAAILSALPGDFSWPLLVVQHLHASDGGSFAEHVARLTRLPVQEACDKSGIEPGWVYTAPANYHMLVEREKTISLSLEERVNWARPAIDVLFESAALAWGERLIAIILSGANSDGAQGIRAVHGAGGLTIAQDPAEAQSPLMPQAAIATGAVLQVLRAAEIGRLVADLAMRRTKLFPDHGYFLQKPIG